jgi:fatty-acyl-CoA synthase
VNPSFVQGPTELPLLDLTIDQAFAETVRKHGESEVLVARQQDVRWTWTELDERVEAFAAGLLELGFRPGDRLGVWATNQWEWIVSQFATARIGVVLVSINPAYRIAELEYVLKKVGCKGLVTGVQFKTSDYIAMLNELLPELASCEPGQLRAERVPSLETVIRIGDGRTPGMFRLIDVLASESTPETPSIEEIRNRLSNRDAINIQFTSGTTGSPKGATLSHHNVLNNARFVAATLRMSSADRVCVPVPMYHCFGMVGGGLVCMLAGATIVFPSESFEPGATLAAVQAERCTTMYGVPTMFVMMLNHPEFSGTDVSTLRTGIMAGAPCPVELMRRAVSEFHLPEITIGYGMTETSPVSFISHPDDPVDKRCGTVGRIAPHAEAKVVDTVGNTVPRGEQGELLTRGYMVMQGYWDDPERTAEAVDEDGWMHTGDLATLDDEGWLRITGRAKDMVIRGGENVYPREVEEVLYRHPKILEAQVFGVPDPKLGEAVAVWVQLREDEALTAEEVTTFCKNEMAHFKVPVHVRFVTEFPMTVTGKIQKFEMRRQLAEELGVQEAETA